MNSGMMATQRRFSRHKALGRAPDTVYMALQCGGEAPTTEAGNPVIRLGTVKFAACLPLMPHDVIGRRHPFPPNELFHTIRHVK